MARAGKVEPFVVRGFSERDFKGEHRAEYAAKGAGLVEPLRGTAVQ